MRVCVTPEQFYDARKAGGCFTVLGGEHYRYGDKEFCVSASAADPLPDWWPIARDGATPPPPSESDVRRWLAKNTPPTTVIDCAGSCLTQEICDMLVMMLKERPDRHSPVDIRLRNVSTIAIPSLIVSYSEI